MAIPSIRNLHTDPASYVVRYKGKYFVWYKTNRTGRAHLIDTHGDKYPGTPTPDKLEAVKSLPHKEFNGSLYFQTKIGIFSANTGNRVTLYRILEMFI